MLAEVGMSLGLKEMLEGKAKWNCLRAAPLANESKVVVGVASSPYCRLLIVN